MTRSILLGKLGGQRKQHDIPARIKPRFEAAMHVVDVAGANVQLIAPVNLHVVFTHFDHCSVSTAGVYARLCFICRPPPSKGNAFNNRVLYASRSIKRSNHNR